MPGLTTLKADFKLADRASCLRCQQTAFDYPTTVWLRTPSEILVQVDFNIFFEFEVFAVDFL
jgi:hypothetical protein